MTIYKQQDLELDDDHDTNTVSFIKLMTGSKRMVK